MSQIVDYPPIYLYKNYGQLMDMAVRPELRRRGLGSLLLAEALRWFKGRGIERVELSVAARNPIGYPFWKKRGFADYMHVLYLNLPPRETSGP
jgi:GNAT superfamily N-acetyltransferase